MDGLPFSVTKGLGFKRVVEFLRPEINMPSSRTVAPQLEHLAANEALPALQDELLEGRLSSISGLAGFAK